MKHAKYHNIESANNRMSQIETDTLPENEQWLCPDHPNKRLSACKNCKLIKTLLEKLSPVILDLQAEKQMSNTKIFDTPPQNPKYHIDRQNVHRMFLIQALVSEHLYKHLQAVTISFPFYKELKNHAWLCKKSHPTQPMFDECIDCQEEKDSLLKIAEKQRINKNLILELLEKVQQTPKNYAEAEKHFQALQTLNIIKSKVKNIQNRERRA